MTQKILEPTKGELVILNQLTTDPEVRIDQERMQVRRTSSRLCFWVEHGDYNGTDLFGAAIGVKPEREQEANGFIWFAYSPNDTGRVRIKSLNEPGVIASFNLGNIPHPSKIHPKYDWTKFPMGTDHVLRQAGYHLKKGLDGVLIGKIPEGGLSRSASLTVNLVYSLLEVNGITNVDPFDVVDMAQAVENVYVHSPCGKLDQTMIVFGQKGKGTLYSQKDRKVEYVDVPAEAEPVDIIILDTGTKRNGLQSSDYEVRQKECWKIRDTYSKEFGFKELADVTPEIYPTLLERIKDPNLKARLKYIFEATQERAPRFMEAWRKGDWITAGEMMNQDGIGLRDDYDLSSPYLEAMIVSARTDPNVLGARFSGGGRYGVCQALRKQAPIEPLRKLVANGYGRSFPGMKHAVHACEFTDGVVKLEARLSRY